MMCCWGWMMIVVMNLKLDWPLNWERLARYPETVSYILNEVYCTTFRPQPDTTLPSNCAPPLST